MNARQFQFEWDEVKAARNAGKHGVTFELARTIFNDPLLVTVADLPNSETEDRWFSIGRAANGALLSVAHLWMNEKPDLSRIRLISARKATQTEIRYYQVGSYE